MQAFNTSEVGKGGPGGQWPLQYLERGPGPPGVTIMKCTYISTVLMSQAFSSFIIMQLALIILYRII